MKKIIMLLLVLLMITGCSNEKEEEFVINDSAAGVILVNDSEELKANTKVYAEFTDEGYVFDLDAAVIYYFEASADTIYAGDQKLVTLTLGANIDDDTVGAIATAAYKLQEDSSNTVSAYYLYQDEKGLYFDTDTSFDNRTIRDNTIFRGDEFSFELTFNLETAVASFVMTYYNEDDEEIASNNNLPEQYADYQNIELGEDVKYVEVMTYDIDGNLLETIRVDRENYTIVLCFDDGGQILDTKYIRFDFD